jgi:hypothetical protein
MSNPPIFKASLSCCVYFSLIVHHLEDVDNLILEWMVDCIFFLEFQSLELTYLLIFKGYDDNGVFSFT